MEGWLSSTGCALDRLTEAAWLAYAIVLWFGVPLVLLDKGTAFVVLAVSMGIRAVIEIPLCLIGRWRVAYGITHDVIHAVIVIMLASELGFWAVLTLLALVSEIVFVTWFVKGTDGPAEGIFFVPAGEAYRKINRRTAAIFLPQAACFVGLIMLSLSAQ